MTGDSNLKKMNASAAYCEERGPGSRFGSVFEFAVFTERTHGPGGVEEYKEGRNPCSIRANVAFMFHALCP